MKKIFALGLVMLLGGQASAGFLNFSVQSGAAVKKLDTQVGKVLNDAVLTQDTINGQTVIRQWGFFERAAFLTSDLAVDGGTVAKSQVVESYMIFLNKPGNSSITREAVWTFSNAILGVMSKTDGSLEAASSFLGSSNVEYPDYNTNYSGKSNRGLESGDSYSISGSDLTLKMNVSQPGDWIRVITASQLSSAQVAEPATMALWGLGAAGFGWIARRRKK